VTKVNLAWAVWLMAAAPVFLVAAAVADGPAVRLVPGDVMPRLTGEFLTGAKAVLPDAARGKVALLALGFSYDSRLPVEAWMKRFRELYPPGDRLTFFEVPMIGGGARLARWFIDSGMRRGTPRDLHGHVVTVYGGTGVWKQWLGVDDESLAYLVLLDREGRVRWLHAGVLDEAGLAALRAAIDPLLIEAGR
jgi:hypothetical protein